MNNKIKYPNFYYLKLLQIIDNSNSLKIKKNNLNLIQIEDSLKIINEHFDKNNRHESHIMNTYNYHIMNFSQVHFKEYILYGNFIYAISFSIINALMDGEKYTKYLFKRVTDNLFEILKIGENNRITQIDYNNALAYFERLFISKSTNSIINIESMNMEPCLLEFHKRVYLQALHKTYKCQNQTFKFRLDFSLNIVLFYENELFKQLQEKK